MAGQTNVENIVASAYVADGLDLARVAKDVDGVEFNPQRFPGAMLRIRRPPHMVLLFPNGKIVTHGSRSLEHAQDAVDQTVALLKDSNGVREPEAAPPLEIQNVVASSDAGHGLDLERLSQRLPKDQVEYDAEQFPGILYRMREPNVVMMVFDSGRLVVTGARSLDEVEAAFARFREEMETLTAR